MGKITTKAKNLYKIVEENYITKVGGTLTKTAEEINIYTTEEGDDYGFDWMRMDVDEKRLKTGGGTKPQKPYKDIVGKYYDEAAFTTLTTVDEYLGKHFNPVLTEFNTLKITEYKATSTNISMKDTDNTTPLADGSKQDRYEAWLSLYPKQIKDPNDSSKWKASGYTKNTKAVLSLVVNTDEVADRYAFEPNEYFTITLKTIPNNLGRQVLNDHLTIECEKEFNTDQKLELYAYKTKEDGTEDKKLAGIINVWANHTPKRKKAKMVLVGVKIPNLTRLSRPPKIVTISNQKDLIENYTLQALIETEIIEEYLDLTTDTKFNPENTITIPSILSSIPTTIKVPGKYIHNIGTASSPDYRIKGYYKHQYKPTFTRNPNEPTAFTSIQNYLFEKLKDQLESNFKEKKPTATTAQINAERNKYNSLYIAFYFAEEGGCIKFTNNYKALNGYTSGKKIVLFSSKNDQTAAHEFLHAFDLPHTHINKEADADAKYTYEYQQTDNLVGYGHHDDVERRSLWKWQWEKANNSIT